ncbi:MAG: 50S ribosomal protein L33 [Candidatus Izimaplasma sp.]|nr:50S ribosomal protein L33 [Candidatus Izimaplasma bacterium]
MRVEFTLKCTKCGNENYRKEKNKRNDTGRLEMKKFCPNCQTHTLHKEKK